MVISLFATVGIDGAAFDRLVGWLDRWLDAYGDRVEAYLHIGDSRVPRWPVWASSSQWSGSTPSGR